MNNVLSSVAQVGAMICFALIAVLAPFNETELFLRYAASFNTLGAGLALLASLTSNKRSGVDFLFWFFFFFFIGLPASVQISMDTFPWFARLRIDYMVLGYGVLALSQFSYSVGMIWSQRSWRPAQVAWSGAQGQAGDRDNGAARFYSRWAVGIALAATIFAVLVGPSALLSPRFDGSGGGEGFKVQFTSICRSLSLLAMVMMIYLARYSEGRRLRLFNLWALLCFAPVFLLINYPPALPRFGLFGMVIALICPFLDYRRPAAKITVAVLGVLALFTVFPVIKEIGHEGATLGSLLDRVGTTAVLPYLLRVDFDGYMQIVSAVQYILDGNGIRWGNNFLGVALFFVPRALWPDKPMDSGQTVSRGLNYWYNNVSSPLPAEAVLAFGVLGPILVFLLLGFIVSRIELRAGFPTERRAMASSFFVYSILMGFIPIILRGALNAVAPQFASAFIVYAMMMYARRHRIVWRTSRA